jgi:hypothetical protein
LRSEYKFPDDNFNKLNLDLKEEDRHYIKDIELGNGLVMVILDFSHIKNHKILFNIHFLIISEKYMMKMILKFSIKSEIF